MRTGCARISPGFAGPTPIVPSGFAVAFINFADSPFFLALSLASSICFSNVLSFSTCRFHNPLPPKNNIAKIAKTTTQPSVPTPPPLLAGCAVTPTVPPPEPVNPWKNPATSQSSNTAPNATTAAITRTITKIILNILADSTPFSVRVLNMCYSLHM